MSDCMNWMVSGFMPCAIAVALAMAKTPQYTYPSCLQLFIIVTCDVWKRSKIT